jgi:LytS/YehU family sensor histidine kinase
MSIWMFLIPALIFAILGAFWGWYIAMRKQAKSPFVGIIIGFVIGVVISLVILFGMILFSHI